MVIAWSVIPRLHDEANLEHMSCMCTLNTFASCMLSRVNGVLLTRACCHVGSALFKFISSLVYAFAQSDDISSLVLFVVLPDPDELLFLCCDLGLEQSAA